MNNETEQIFLLNSSDLQPSIAPQKETESTETPAGQVNLENIEDFSTVCRTCATITEFLIPIFSGEGLQNNLADKIHKHLPIKVSEEDALPRAVCYQCAHTLLAWHELEACCRQADHALTTRLHQLQQNTQKQQDLKPKVNEDSQAIESNPQNEKYTVIVEVKTEDSNNIDEKKETPKIVLAEDGKKYVECRYCKKSVIFASWRRHMRCHRGEKRHSCHTCGLSFSDSGNLARHTRTLHSKQRPYICAICQKTFSRNSHLQDHIKSHSESREFVCDLCGKGSKSSAALRMHRKTHDSDMKFKCMECGAKFKRRGELSAHVSVHTGERAHVCACGRAFRLRSQLTAHSRTHKAAEEKTFEGIGNLAAPPPGKAPPSYPAPPAPSACPYCPSQLEPDEHKQHLVQAHTELFFHCDECDAYVDRKDFILHMSLHVVQYSSETKTDDVKKPSKKKKKIKDENENTEACQESDVTTECNEAEMLEIEIPVVADTLAIKIKQIDDDHNDFSDHSDTDFNFGPLPDSVFTAIEDSQDSQPVDSEPAITPEAIEDEITEKDVENDTVNNKTDINVQMDLNFVEATHFKPSTDKNKKIRKCHICGKVYTVASSYFYHMKSSHKKTRDHECELCGRKFWTKVVLTQHMNTHSNLCENECKICGKKLKSKSSLYIHTQNHIGAKKFSCEQCQISFRWRTHLLRHIKRHSTEKPHICTTCGRAFTIRCDLLRHMRTHSAGKFECKKCGVSFAQVRYLKAHVDKKHSTQTSEIKNDVPVTTDEAVVPKPTEQF